MSTVANSPPRPRRLLAALSLALASLAAPPFPRAAALPPDRDAAEHVAAGQPVPLPHALRDGSGFTWNVNQDGSVTDGHGAVFTGGAQLILGPNGNFQYASPNGQATFDAARNELTFPAMPAAGLSVSRRVSVDARGGWCRFVEVFENATDGVVRTQVRVRSHLAGPVHAAQAVHGNGAANGAGDAAGGEASPNAVVVSGGDDGVAFIAGGKGGRVAPQFQAQPETDFVDVGFDLEVPPRRTVAIVHVLARRPTLNEAVAFARSTRDRQFLRGIAPPLLKAVANFAPQDRVAVAGDLLRGDLLDVVELRGGDVYKGTIRHETWRLKTVYGDIELPATRVVGMVTLGEFRPVQLFVTDGGEVLGGALRAEAVRLELSGGHVTTIPLSLVRRMGYRLRPDEAGEGAPRPPAPDKQVLALRAGDRIVVEPPAGPISVATSYGVLRLDPKAVASLSFQSDEHGVHEIRLVDGSRFAGVVAQDRFDLTPAGAAAKTNPAREPVSFPAASIARLQLAPDVPDVSPGAATLKLANGDLLAGTLSGKLVLETAFDTIEVGAEELSGLTPAGEGDGGAAAEAGGIASGEVRLTLWDGATLSGRVRGDAVDCVLASGATVRVPVASVRRYAQPNPRPSERAVARVREVVGQLDDNDWKVRDRAAAQLAAMGPGAAALLKALRDGQPPEVRQRIDQILASLDPAAPSPVSPGKPPEPIPVPIEPGAGGGERG